MSFFSKVFPFPDYLRIPAVGVDVSDRSIKYAELEKYKKRFRLKSFGEKNIEEGIIESGEIKQKDKLVEELKLLNQDLDNRFVFVSLPEEKIFLKIVQLPMMEEKQIRKSLEVQIEEMVPFPPNEILFDFEITSRGGDALKVVLAAFPKKLAEDYVEVFESAGFVPLAFEGESQSILRALTEPNQKESVMIIDFGRTHSGFLIGNEGTVRFTSTIKVAGSQIDQALAKSLGIDIFQAERFKRKKGVLSDSLPVLSVVKDETKRILQYWQTHAEEEILKEKKIKKIILCGGDANIPGLIEYLSRNLDVEVEEGNPWINITSFDDYIPQIEKNKSLRYVTALGLSLRSFEEVL